MTIHVRAATAADAAGVAAIYEPIVADTAISFEVTPPTATELARRIEAGNRTHGWLVALAQSTITGYAYGTGHRAREAYRYSTETSVYVHPDYQGRGVGSLLYQALFDVLAQRGYYHAFAGITLPNAASTSLHARMRFRHIGTFPNVGYKFGRWHDVSWWYRELRFGTPDDPTGDMAP